MSTQIVLHPKEGVDGKLELRRLLLEADYTRNKSRGGKSLGWGLGDKYERLESTIKGKKLKPFKLETHTIGNNRNNLGAFFLALPNMAQQFFSVKIPSMTRRSSRDKVFVGRLLSNALAVMCKLIPGSDDYVVYVVYRGNPYMVQKGLMYPRKARNTELDVSAGTLAMGVAKGVWDFVTGAEESKPRDGAIRVATVFSSYIATARQVYKSLKKNEKKRGKSSHRNTEKQEDEYLDIFMPDCQPHTWAISSNGTFVLSPWKRLAASTESRNTNVRNMMNSLARTTSPSARTASKANMGVGTNRANMGVGATSRNMGVGTNMANMGVGATSRNMGVEATFRNRTHVLSNENLDKLQGMFNHAPVIQVPDPMEQLEQLVQTHRNKRSPTNEKHERFKAEVDALYPQGNSPNVLKEKAANTRQRAASVIQKGFKQHMARKR